MTCTRCERPFQEGDMITATIVSVYHEIKKPGMDEFKFAVERPHAATNLKHLCCLEDGSL